MTEIACSLPSPLLHLYVYISVINAQKRVWVSGDCARLYEPLHACIKRAKRTHTVHFFSSYELNFLNIFFEWLNGTLTDEALLVPFSRCSATALCAHYSEVRHDKEKPVILWNPLWTKNAWAMQGECHSLKLCGWYWRARLSGFCEQKQSVLQGCCHPLFILYCGTAILCHS